MTKSITSPAPGEIGHNSMVPTSAQITEELTMRYAELHESVGNTIASAGSLPDKIASKDALGESSRVVLAMRELAKTAESNREAEKGPYWRAGLSVDAFFKEMITRLDKTAVMINRRINDYQQAQLAAERRKREEERIEAARVAEEARLKAERARKAATREAAEVEAALAERRRAEAAEAAEATPAGMVRERFADGPLVTMQTVKYVEISDISLIPLEQLRPYLKPSDIEAAVKRWAVNTEYRGTLPGVTCGTREESVVR
jgi:hypothetical protein